jgi:hypothetical protein
MRYATMDILIECGFWEKLAFDVHAIDVAIDA